jgi:tripartite-type tricarboxylate transporter receptor subunit TctC
MCLARVIVKPLSEALGQTVIIENKPGAGGNIGINYVARAKPDGHTLLITTSVLVINPSLYKSAGFDPNEGLLSNIGLWSFTQCHCYKSKFRH